MQQRGNPMNQRTPNGHDRRGSNPRALLLEQLRAIERGESAIPRAMAASADAAAAAPNPSNATVRRLPRSLHLALGLLLVAAVVGMSGGSGIAPGEPVRLNVASYARAADGSLQVRAEPVGTRQGVPLLAGAERIARPDRATWIAAPELGIDAAVAEAGLVMRGGAPTWEVVANAAAHYSGSAMPGENGNVVIAGHLSTPLSRQGAVFRKLPQAKVGQVIYVWAGDVRHTYTVDSVRVVSPKRTDVMAPTDEPRLTLITCYPDVTFKERLVVTATYTPGA